MAEPSGPGDRAVRGGRLDRRRGAAGRPASGARARPTGRGREPDRRQRQYRHRAAAKAAPDGYTILIVPETIVSNPHVYKVGYDPLKDFVPVVQISRQPIVLAAHPSLGVKTIAELVALAKKEPGMRYATGSGAGSQQHMVTAWFAKLAGIELEQVSYRGGGQAINDLIAGHVKLGTLGSTPLIPHYKAGALAAARADDRRAIAGAAGCSDLRGGGHQGPDVRPMARRVRAAGHAARDRRAAQRRRSARRWPIRRSRRTSRTPRRSRSAAAAKPLRSWCATTIAKFEKLVKELNIKVN